MYLIYLFFLFILIFLESTNFYILNFEDSSILLFVQAQERQESDIKACHEEKRSQLKTEIVDLEEKVARGNGGGDIANGFDKSLHNSLEELNTAKKVQFYKFIATLVILLIYNIEPGSLALVDCIFCLVITISLQY